MSSATEQSLPKDRHTSTNQTSDAAYANFVYICKLRSFTKLEEKQSFLKTQSLEERKNDESVFTHKSFIVVISGSL